MGGRASKQKGKAWEREICSFLGETLGGSFIRVPNSGAFIGGKNTARKILLDSGQIRNAKGDIIPPDNLPLLNIEAKNYADIAFNQILNGSCKQLDAWIDQTEEPADPEDVSFTIFKITRKGSWVAFKASLLAEFNLNGLTFLTYRKDFGNANACDYVIVDHESFFIQNKDKICQLGSGS